MTDGEHWAREELERLRDRRFAPSAIAAFLAASQRRAANVRRARPDLARQARRWEAAGLGAWALLAAGRRSSRPSLAPGLAWWGATCLMLEWHLGMFESEDGRPRDLGAADALTLTRAWLVPVIAGGPAPAALGVAALTDALDGPVARASTPTRAGRDLEGLVDAAVLVAALRSAAREQRLNRLVVRLELARLGAGVAFATAAYFARARPPSAALLRAARWTTPVRLAGLMAAGTRRRRSADLLVGGGSLASLGMLFAAARDRPA